MKGVSYVQPFSPRRILLVSSYPARILTISYYKAHAYSWGAKHLRAKPLLYAFKILAGFGVPYKPKGAYCSLKSVLLLVLIEDFNKPFFNNPLLRRSSRNIEYRASGKG